MFRSAGKPRDRTRAASRWLCVTAVCALGALVALSAHDAVPEQIAALSAQIVRQPLNAELLVRRADLYRLERKWVQSIADLDRAGSLDSSFQAPHLIRARLLFDKGEWHGAERASTAFLERQPAHAEALLIRARTRVKLGKTAGAIEDFTSTLDVRPVPEVYLERGRAIRGTTRQSIAASLRSLDEGVARIGQVVTLQLEAIDLEVRLSRFDAALARLDQLAAQSSRKDSWLARRGAILEHAGRREEARDSYRAALAAASASSMAGRTSPASRQLIQQVTADLARLEAGAIKAGGTKYRH